MNIKKPPNTMRIASAGNLCARAAPAATPITAVIGVAAGAALAHKLPADAMRIVFGGFFMFMGIMLARKGWTVAKKYRNGDTPQD